MRELGCERIAGAAYRRRARACGAQFSDIVLEYIPQLIGGLRLTASGRPSSRCVTPTRSPPPRSSTERGYGESAATLRRKAATSNRTGSSRCRSRTPRSPPLRRSRRW
ncbi:hypothetical protein HBB16_00090 [Pseudonocardia sp. MCCB 268]|nr:hypothetical protein [Pseudonocardia cytotoxica]